LCAGPDRGAMNRAGGPIVVIHDQAPMHIHAAGTSHDNYTSIVSQLSMLKRWSDGIYAF
jgi:hypothetical protein